MPSAIEPNQDRIEVGVAVGGSLSLEGRDMGATSGYDESARAGGAQAAREERRRRGREPLTNGTRPRGRLCLSKQKRRRRLANKPG